MSGKGSKRQAGGASTRQCGEGPEMTFWNGVFRGSVKKVARALADGWDVNEADWEGRTALMLAAGKGDTAMAAFLLERGALLELTTPDGRTALAMAAASDHAAMAAFLLERGADPGTGLVAAACGGALNTLRLFLHGGVHPDLPDAHGCTALMAAAATGQTAVAALLLDHGADLEVRSVDSFAVTSEGAVLEDEIGAADVEVFHGWTALMIAAAAGSLPVCALLLDYGADQAAKDIMGQTALMLAAARDKAEVVTLLLDRGADPGVRDEDGRTARMLAAEAGAHRVLSVFVARTENDAPAADRARREMDPVPGGRYRAPCMEPAEDLLMAVRCGSPATVRRLLEQGADVNARSGPQGMTLLMEAAATGHAAVCEVLLEHGAALDLMDEEGATALTRAVRSDHLGTARLLLKHGASCAAPDGQPPLHCAAERDNTRTLALLLDYDDDMEAQDRRGRTALIRAAQNGAVRALDFLIARGARLEARDRRGATAYMAAVEQGCRDCVERRLEAGANADAARTAELEVRSREDRTRLMTAAGARDGEKFVRQLLSQGADPRARTRAGETPLILALRRRRWASAAVLIAAGAPVNCRDSRGQTPLDSAAGGGHVRTCELLLERGADIEARDARGWTPFMTAARENRVKVMRLLMARGANIEARDARGWTPLMAAVCEGHVEAARLLLENGAVTDLRDPEGRTLMELAGASLGEDMAALLREHGAVS